MLAAVGVGIGIGWFKSELVNDVASSEGKCVLELGFGKKSLLELVPGSVFELAFVATIRARARCEACRALK